MEDISRLNEAFNNFTLASRSLENSYEKLQEKVTYLTEELAEKNRQLEAALNDTGKAKDYLKGVLQSLGEAIIVLDPERNVTMVNRAAEEMLGPAVGHSLGMPFALLNLSMEGKGADTILVANNRRYNILFCCSEVLDHEGGLRGHVLLFQDITRIKELEYQQERNHRLIAMGEMAAKIVHEIRSPLCSIELYASILSGELADVRHVELAGGISTGIRSLNNVLTNMLFFAKPHNPLVRTVDLGEALEESVRMLRPLIDSRGLRLSGDTSRRLSADGDPELLKQGFLNILINAVQATPEGGTIELILKNDGAFEVVEVRDDGEGISPCDTEKIFDPFFSTKERGTGLGLTIASQIMQAHGGLIKVSSGPGKGSCFQLCFPDRRTADMTQRRILLEEIFV